jgi:EAL domain-containing protein (putative c-di-GMP-specific phosphodiesterase class I)/GGDEF domain-containing protein
MEGRGHPLRGSHGLRPLGLALGTWSLVAASILIGLWLFGDSEDVPQRWLPYLALTIPILAVYLLPGGLPRLALPLFVLAWTAVHLRLFTSGGGVLDEPAMLNGQMIIFTATLVGFLAIEAVHSYDLANRQLDAARLHDGLTGLYNDLGLTEQLRDRTEEAASSPPHALIGIQVPDIDDLATLTGLDEAHGIERRIADTLRHCVSSREGLGARLQPGLFALLVPVTVDGVTPLTLANRLCAGLREAESEGRLPVARLGLRVALVEGVEPSQHGHLTSLLLMACQRAGKQETERFYHHREAPNHLIDGHRDVLDWAGRLRDALAGNAKNGDFELFAQPILERDRPEVHRAEILIRWRQPDGSLKGPDSFLGIAENFGLMPRIDEWVLNRALALVAGHPAGRHLTEIAINLSGNSLEGATFPETLAAALEHNAWPPAQLCLEITETMLIQDTQLARHNVQAIHDLGVRLAIDDFGTGHATFAYLKQYPVEELKIDGSFIRDITTSGFDREVVRSTCALADFLDARVVAEFVETQAQMDALADLGVNYLQGYGIAHPMPLITYLDSLLLATPVLQRQNGRT